MKKKTLALILAVAVYSCVNAQNIYTVAGNGSNGYTGNGGSATNAEMNTPKGIAVDAAGNIYIADYNNNVIRKVTFSTGNISTVAGNGTYGYSGDGGVATSAELAWPIAVAVDDSGNIYINDYNNARIRKVTLATGFISTVAGNGTSGFTGDGGLATLAEISQPSGIAVDDSSNIYISDGGNNRIRKVTKKTGKINTIAGNGTGGYSGDGGAATLAEVYGPAGIAVDASGNVYIADALNDCIRKVAVSTGNISTVAGSYSSGFKGDGGPATSASFYDPTGVAVDAAGNIYISDQLNNRIREVNTHDTINTVAGDGNASYYGDGAKATAAALSNPYAVAVDASGNIYISDTYNDRIREVKECMLIMSQPVSKSVCAGTNTTVSVGTSAAGLTYQWKVNSGSGFKNVVNSSIYSGATSGVLHFNAVPYGYDGNMYVCQITSTTCGVLNTDTITLSVTECNRNCGVIATIIGDSVLGFSGDSGKADTTTINQAAQLVIDKFGNMYFADASNNRVRKIAVNTSIVTTVAGNGVAGFYGDGGKADTAELHSPTGVALDSAGNLYIADYWNERIRKVDAKTGIITTIAGNGSAGYYGDGGPATSAEIFATSAVTVDKAGNIYLPDAGNYRVRKISMPGGIINTIAGNGIQNYSGDGGLATAAEISAPTDVKLDAAGNIFISDNDNNRIRVIDAKTGIITTVVGNGVFGYAGDGGPALAAKLAYPVGIALDPAGDIFIADQYNHRLRKYTKATGIITTIAGTGTIGFSGDWGPADSAKLNYPTYVTLDDSGNAYLNDASNNRIREIFLSQCPLLCKGGFDLTGNLSVCIDTPKYNSASIQACIFNNRCLPVNATLKLIVDTAIHISNIISDSTAKISGDTLTWKFDTLSYVSKAHCVSLSGTVDSLPAGDSVFVTMLITPTKGDSMPSNNSVTYWIKAYPYNCVGLPFDPNNKSVIPIGNISSTQKLTYTIHFQNTGTAVAKDVVVIDTLSANVDPTTLDVISSSSPVTIQVVSGHIIKFIFNNINLPDTAMSKTTSIGMFTYTIMPMGTVVSGDKILNTAEIYFDANPAIITNTTLNTIKGTVTGIQDNGSISRIACFPNPFSSTTSIIFNTGGTHYLELDDITGRRIETMECNGRQYELSRNGLAPGLYFIRSFDEGGKNIATTKIVVE